MQSSQIQVLIADDHTLFGKLVKMMLKTSKDINVVSVVTDGEQVLEVLKKNEIDVILLDIDMPTMDGLQTMNHIVRNHPNIKIIMLTNHSEAWIIKKSMQSGASGYLTKFAESDEVVDAITTVFKGGNYFCKTSFNNMMQSMTNHEKPAASNSTYHSLTDREKEILKLIAEENTTKEISDILCISKRTVETHRKNILHKIGAKNTVGLIKSAVEANLLEKEN